MCARAPRPCALAGAPLSPENTRMNICHVASGNLGVQHARHRASYNVAASTVRCTRIYSTRSRRLRKVLALQTQQHTVIVVSARAVGRWYRGSRAPPCDSRSPAAGGRTGTRRSTVTEARVVTALHQPRAHVHYSTDYYAVHARCLRGTCADGRPPGRPHRSFSGRSAREDAERALHRVERLASPRVARLVGM